ncbi:MAG: AbrB/MazE/SpoVT family DNA-binding domain-containing protein [Eubacteriales bacterium]|jgi:transcriptional pleiotropic regulator of transition state genes
MKENITRKLDELGRIVIPSDFRKKLDIKTGDRLRVELVDNTLVFRKSVPTCIFCGKSEGLTYENHNKYVCEDCVKTIAAQVRK